MQQNWYVLCTKSKQEAKVVSLLEKKNIECYCPFTITETQLVSRKKKAYAPVFTNFVFVKITAPELQALKKIKGVLNTLFWKKDPAVITAEEINAIKMMTENYSTVNIEKTLVNPTEKISVKERSITGLNNKVVSIKHHGISVELPSLGYSISAVRAKSKTATPEKIKQSLSQLLVKGFTNSFLFNF